MKNFKYLGGGILVGGVVLGFYLLSKETKLEKLKRETNKKAKEIVITSFVEIIIENPKINLEDAILKFENVEEGVTLDDFAESKNRIKDNYVSVYREYFDNAKRIVFS